MRSALWKILADLYAYPREHPGTLLCELGEYFEYVRPELSMQVEKVKEEFEKFTVQELEEIYTRTFDLQPVFSPYVGEWIYGLTWQRNSLLSTLAEIAEECGINTEELPDHIGVLFSVLAKLNDQKSTFIKWLLRVWTDRAEGRFHKAPPPYASLLTLTKNILLNEIEDTKNQEVTL